MIAGLSAGVLLVDAIVVMWTAWIATCAAGLGRRGLVEGLLAWLLLALAWVAGSGVVLGLCGGLGRMGFLAIHALGLAVALVARRSWRDDLREGRERLGDWWRWWRGGTAEGFIAAGLALGLLALGALAALAEPVTYDVLTYRLPRIGAWLQEGWIRGFPTDDPRLNYMPVAPDVVMAWLLGGTDAGFRLAPLAQLAGGVLLIGATFGLARTIGLSRLQGFGAVGVLLGMANVAVQLTTIQSDLFTAGVFAAGYLLWHRAWQRGEGSWVAGIGVALAFGSKGTMFYLAPGVAIWAGWLIWQRRGQWQALGPSAAGLIAAALVFVGPGWWRNHATYGSVFGPRDAVVLHHGSFDSPGQHAEKLARNLGTSAVQLFEPTAQPAWLMGGSRAIGARLADRLPAGPDPYVFIGQSRRDQVQRVMALTEPDADVVTCGLLAVGLFTAGLVVAAARSKQSGASQILVWGLGVAAYLATQHALVQWHHWAFRFVVLAAPWMAVVGAWAISGMPRMLRVAVWSVLLVSATDVFLNVQARANQAAWQAKTQPARAASYYHYLNWRLWAGRLDPVDAPLRLAFPIDRPLAAFYRTDTSRRITLESLDGLRAGTAEAAVADAPGWLVVPLEHFLGREGRVRGRIGPFAIAAYRALASGERPVPLIYGFKARKMGENNRDELLVRTWADAQVRFKLTNPASAPCAFVLTSPAGVVNGTVPAGGDLIVEVPMPPDVADWVTVDYAPLGPAADAQGGLLIRLAP